MRKAASVCTGWLRQAADLYRGDLLTGFAVRDSVGFEEWQLTRQEALHGQVIEALARLTDYYEHRGEHAQVLEYAVAAGHARAVAGTGANAGDGRAGAVGAGSGGARAVRSYSRMLSREFGILPSSEATALWEQIRSKHAGRGQAAAFPPEAETATAVSRMASAGAPAVSRDERRQVTALVCRLQAASGAAGPTALTPRSYTSRWRDATSSARRFSSASAGCANHGRARTASPISATQTLKKMRLGERSRRAWRSWRLPEAAIPSGSAFIPA